MSEFYALRDAHGEFYVYSAPDIGVRHATDMNLARKYSSLRGARVAQAMLERKYGYLTTPTYHHAKITYHEATPISD